MTKTKPGSHEDAAVLDAIGPPTQVARLLYRYREVWVSGSTVRQWRHRGVPFRLRADVASVARNEGIDVPANFETRRTYGARP